MLSSFFITKSWVKLFISKGADNWYFALQAACRKNHYKIAKLLIKKTIGNLNSILADAIQSEYIKIVKLLLRFGAKLNLPPVPFERPVKTKIRKLILNCLGLDIYNMLFEKK